MSPFDTLVVDSVCSRAVEYSQQYRDALAAGNKGLAEIITYQIKGLAQLSEDYMSGKESSERHLGGIQ